MQICADSRKETCLSAAVFAGYYEMMQTMITGGKIKIQIFKMPHVANIDFFYTEQIHWQHSIKGAHYDNPKHGPDSEFRVQRDGGTTDVHNLGS